MIKRPQILVLPLLLLWISACQDNIEMVTVALESASDVTGDTETSATTSTAGTAGTTDATGTNSMTGTSAAESESTGEAPAPCDTAPECTAPGDADGDPGPTTVPYFRGRACVAKEAKPGQALPVRLEACLHPCLEPNAFSFRHAYRCPGGLCEATATVYYPGVTGTLCPSDVFAKFDPQLCDYMPAIDLLVGPLTAGGDDFEGLTSVVIPYLSNEEAEQIDGGADSSAEIWQRVDANTQEASRFFEVTIKADAADAPALCDDPELCECHDVGF
ncbi:MAG TPA: hypothetical protein ENK31_06565 [Nannocystis exedens]|nr:hypothetical protein [Nannocystis exedens]